MRKGVRPSTKFITYNGQTKSLSEWSRITGIPYPTLASRLMLGWDPNKLIKTPVNKNLSNTKRKLLRIDAESHLNSLARDQLPGQFASLIPVRHHNSATAVSRFGSFIRYNHPSLFDHWFKEEYPKIHDSQACRS